MSKKGTIEVFQTKISRNDRFAQMSHQEKLIEQKKREIQAKLEQKNASKDTETTPKASTNNKNAINKSSIKSSGNTTPDKDQTDKNNDKKAFNFNTFSNDGSFLNQFKQMKDKKKDHNHKNKFINSATNQNLIGIANKQGGNERDERTNKKWKKEPTMMSKDNRPNQKSKPSRFNNDAKINITTLGSTLGNIITNTFDASVITAQDVTGQPLLKNLVQSPQSQPQLMLAAPPIMMNVPPPQIQIHTLPAKITVDLCPTTVITTVTLPQAPESIITVPPPMIASLQVHAELNEIPNPKPLDLLAIPTPNEERNAEFIKNVPPPNKSVPPPSCIDTVPTCIPPPNIMPPTSMPPPQANLNLMVQQLAPPVPVAVPIPSLMAQPIMPPTMGIVPPPQINVPPPAILPAFNPPLIPVNVPPPQIAIAANKDINSVFPPGSADYEAMASLGRMVAQCGPGIEDVVRQRKNQDPSLWFLFNKNSAAYRQYQTMVDQFRSELAPSADSASRSDQDDYKPEDIYESDAMCDDDLGELSEPGGSGQYGCKRKRKSRWGCKDESVPPPSVVQTPILPSSTGVMLSKITRQDPGFINYVISTYGSANLNEETWKKAEDNYKVHLVYQEMLKKKQDLERLQQQGRNKYEYDSDEEVDGGTWEHKQREKEMLSTSQWANDLTSLADGKHHIGDFLPPEEFQKLLKDPNGAKDASDYSEHKLGEDNKGFKMLQKLGWSEGKGLGTTEKGILEPINKGFVSRDGQGLGQQDGSEGNEEDEYDAYRKRMMLAYKFRPNPLNNPRRAYY